MCCLLFTAQANVMLEYEAEEAYTLLSQNLENAQTNVTDILKDLDFLRDQITTMEVSILLSLHGLFLSLFVSLMRYLCFVVSFRTSLASETWRGSTTGMFSSDAVRRQCLSNCLHLETYSPHILFNYFDNFQYNKPLFFRLSFVL